MCITTTCLEKLGREVQRKIENIKKEKTKYAGFNILVRARTTRLRNEDSIMQPDMSNAGTDNIAAIFWQKSSVAKALGNVAIFDNPDRAEYYGDLISFLLRSGGRCRRSDKKGVGLLVAKP